MFSKSYGAFTRVILMLLFVQDNKRCSHGTTVGTTVVDWMRARYHLTHPIITASYTNMLPLANQHSISIYYFYNTR